MSPDRIDCPQCAAAQREPKRDEFAVGCISCDARALAVTRADLLPEYRTAAERVFGERLREGHQLVRSWLSTLRQCEAMHRGASGGAA
jgi:hypothetical protein